MYMKITLFLAIALCTANAVKIITKDPNDAMQFLQANNVNSTSGRPRSRMVMTQDGNRVVLELGTFEGFNNQTEVGFLVAAAGLVQPNFDIRTGASIEGTSGGIPCIGEGTLAMRIKFNGDVEYFKEARLSIAQIDHYDPVYSGVMEQYLTRSHYKRFEEATGTEIVSAHYTKIGRLVTMSLDAHNGTAVDDVFHSPYTGSQDTMGYLRPGTELTFQIPVIDNSVIVPGLLRMGEDGTLTISKTGGSPFSSVGATGWPNIEVQYTASGYSG